MFRCKDGNFHQVTNEEDTSDLEDDAAAIEAIARPLDFVDDSNETATANN